MNTLVNFRPAQPSKTGQFSTGVNSTDQAIAGWEKNSKVPKFADQMLRVFYAAHTDGNEQIKNIIHALNDVERMIHFVMTETKQGW